MRLGPLRIRFDHPCHLGFVLMSVDPDRKTLSDSSGQVFAVARGSTRFSAAGGRGWTDESFDGAASTQ